MSNTESDYEEKKPHQQRKHQRFHLESSDSGGESGGSGKRHRKKTLFSLWPKRSTKIGPHPNAAGLDGEGSPSGIMKRHSNIEFARTSPQKGAKKPNSITNNHISSTENNVSNKKANKSSQENYNHHITNDQELSDNFKTRPRNLKKKIINNVNPSGSNRLSHQFSLCCSVDRKPQTPPVSVRYGSLPENVNTREKSLFELDGGATDIEEAIAPLAEIECNSAPETPINGNSSKIHCSFNNSHSSPSTTSVQSTQSDVQPRSIAITACKSRLRLKLLPPGKTIVDQNLSNDTSDHGGGGDSSFREQQHLSSPNIPTQELIMQKDMVDSTRSMSHEGIQSIHRNQVNTDSLAKQALMAAQVLSLIPTEKARQRNYLAGRLAVNSLLGTSELIRLLPNKDITIFVGTWNMNGQSPPKEMNDFVLPSGVQNVPDLVAIGTQESCPERFEWEVTLQETLGPSHILFHSTYLGTLHLAIFLRRDLVWFCSVPEDSCMSVRPGTAFRTKGAIAISFCLFGTSMLFVTSHLTAHQQKVKERVQDVKRIINALDLPRNLHLRHKNKDVTQNFDCVFWCGDLNFRLGEPREKLLEWIENTKFPLPSHLPHGYMHTDQLSAVLADGAAFKGFKEANITFPPTYKYDPGTQHFDTSSKQRAPAYTDRILYKYKQPIVGLRRASAISGPFLSSQPSTPIECIAYDSVPTIVSSDHKPVWGLFRVNIRPGIDSVPLAAGLFNREVYLEDLRKYFATLDDFLSQFHNCFLTHFKYDITMHLSRVLFRAHFLVSLRKSRYLFLQDILRRAMGHSTLAGVK